MFIFGYSFSKKVLKIVGSIVDGQRLARNGQDLEVHLLSLIHIFCGNAAHIAFIRFGISGNYKGRDLRYQDDKNHNGKVGNKERHLAIRIILHIQFGDISDSTYVDRHWRCTASEGVHDTEHDAEMNPVDRCV